MFWFESLLMRSRLYILLTVTALLVASQAASAQKAARPAPQVTVDVSEVPELAPWAAEAQRLVAAWHPRIAELLPSDGFAPPLEVKLVFKKDMKGVAGTSAGVISIAANWVKQHPDDYGMVIHELTHIVQAYPKADPGWLTEGIADYVRLFHFEPQAKLNGIDPERQSYRDGYRTSASFLAWIERTHDKDIIRKLNAAMRSSRYRYDLFRQYTGHSLDRLWADFLESEDARGR